MLFFKTTFAELSEKRKIVLKGQNFSNTDERHKPKCVGLTIKVLFVLKWLLDILSFVEWQFFIFANRLFQNVHRSIVHLKQSLYKFDE